MTRVGARTLDGSGHNRTKGRAEKGGVNANSRAEAQHRLRQTRDVSNDEGLVRMHRVDKMDTEANSQKG